jgi:hypothetical protein
LTWQNVMRFSQKQLVEIVPQLTKPRSAAYAGQVGEKDTETLFGLRGNVSSMDVIEHSIPWFYQPTRSVTTFKLDGNRIEHTVEEKCSGAWQMRSRYVYGYSKEGARSGPRFYRADENGAELVLDHSLEFEYEENKVRRSLQNQFSASGALQFTQYFSYNSRGERTGIEWILPTREIIRTYKFSYSVLNGFWIRKLSSFGREMSFDFFDIQLSGDRIKIAFRLGRWSLPSVTIRYEYAADRFGNATKSIALRAFPFKRMIPLLAIVLQERQFAYHPPVECGMHME